ncbi:MAG: hypothetical protein L0Y76_08295, partial [Ignavibacteria bacterium]|nr:hypothetical protein [Ignavibacteria bacterium]
MLKKIVIPFLIFAWCVFSQEKEITVVVMDLFGDNFASKDLAELTAALEKELVKTGYFKVED